jgi:type III secretory pathway component EscU
MWIVVIIVVIVNDYYGLLFGWYVRDVWVASVKIFFQLVMPVSQVLFIHVLYSGLPEAGFSHHGTLT